MEFLAGNWLYIVFAGVMVYMMIKGGGCCGGHSHSMRSNGGHSHGGGCCGRDSHDNHGDRNHRYHEHEQQVNQLDTVKDPICGMTVNPNTAIKQTIDGETYFFCSEACRTEFVRSRSSLLV
jgi:YHS domain-containing protein